MKPDRSVIQWLLDSDPSIRWQVMIERDRKGSVDWRRFADGEGRPGRWNTLRALRALTWYSTR